MRKQVVAGLMLFTLAGTAGACATIMQSSKQDISFASNPSGARVFLNGQQIGITPAVAKVPRKGTHMIRIEMDGYQPHELALTRSVSGWVAGNIVFGGLIGLGVDAATGGMYKLEPHQVNAELVRASTSVVSSDDELPLVLVVTNGVPADAVAVGQLNRE